MQKLIVLGAIAALLFAAAGPALAITRPEEVGYINYASANNNNTRATFNVVGNASIAFFGSATGFTNARFLGMYTVNNSFAGANGSQANALVFGAMASDKDSQINLAAGFKSFGLNASNASCGSYDNTTDLLVGNCGLNAGKNGTSAVGRQKRNLYFSAYDGTGTGTENPGALYARDMTKMIQGLMTAFINIQQGQVAVLDNARDKVA